MNCPKCGAEVGPLARRCPKCFTDVEQTRELPRPPRTKAPLTQAQQPAQEKIIFEATPTFTRPVIVLLITVFFIIGWLLVESITGGRGLVCAGPACVFTCVFILMIFHCFTTNYTLTDRRVKVQSGLLLKSSRSIPLEHVQSVTWETAGFWGDITVTSAAGRWGHVRMAGIDDAQAHAEKIMQTIHDRKQ